MNKSQREGKLNENQLLYSDERFYERVHDIATTALAGGSTYGTTYFLTRFVQHPPQFWWMPLALGAGYLAVSNIIHGIPEIMNRAELFTKKARIWLNPRAYPLESVDRIEIADKGGLATILEKTRGRDEIEWGTPIKVSAEEKTAMVTKILHPMFSKAFGYTYGATENRISFDNAHITQGGFNGVVHYHPEDDPGRNGGPNFVVSKLDRVDWLGDLELLAFNMPNGPEIIGFNRRYTYIPKGKRKSLLVRATHADIMKYLAERS